MADVRLARSIPVIVDSPIIGKTAFSVPLEDVSDTGQEYVIRIPKAAIEDEIEHREEAMLESKPREGIHRGDVAVGRLAAIAREKVEDGELTWYEIAARCGWFARASGGRQQPDTQRVQRVLGLKPGHEEKRFIRADVADALAAALNVDPVEAGF